MEVCLFVFFQFLSLFHFDKCHLRVTSTRNGKKLIWKFSLNFSQLSVQVVSCKNVLDLMLLLLVSTLELKSCVNILLLSFNCQVMTHTLGQLSLQVQYTYLDYNNYGSYSTSMRFKSNEPMLVYFVFIPIFSLFSSNTESELSLFSLR